MRIVKRVMTLLLAALLVVPAANVAAATGSGTTKDLSKTTATTDKGSYYIEYKVKGWTYNGKFKYPKVTATLVETDANGKTTRTALKEGTDYTFQTGQGDGTLGKHKIAMAHKTKLIGKGVFANSKYIAKYTVKKAKAKLTTKVSKKTYKVKTLKKKKKSFSIGAKSSKFVAKSKIKYSKSKTKKSLRKYITVSKSGKVTLKKGAKKGTYKITVKVKGTDNYKGKTKTVKIVVK